MNINLLSLSNNKKSLHICIKYSSEDVYTAGKSANCDLTPNWAQFIFVAGQWLYTIQCRRPISATDAHNHVNSHVLRRITYVTCQTSHTYNTISVLLSNLLPSSRMSPRSAHYWQHYYMKTNNLSKVSYYSCQTKFTSYI